MIKCKKNKICFFIIIFVILVVSLMPTYVYAKTKIEEALETKGKAEDAIKDSVKKNYQKTVSGDGAAASKIVWDGDKLIAESEKIIDGTNIPDTWDEIVRAQEILNQTIIWIKANENTATGTGTGASQGAQGSGGGNIRDDDLETFIFECGEKWAALSTQKGKESGINYTKYSDELKNADKKLIEKVLKDDNFDVTSLPEDVKENWKKKIGDDVVLTNLLNGERSHSSLGDLVSTNKDGNMNLYSPPVKVSDAENGDEDNSKKVSSSIDDIFSDAEKLTNHNAKIDSGKISDFSQIIYNIFLMVGIAVATIAGAVLGIQFMISSAEGKADVKKLLIAYVAGCIAVFGSFAIWKMVVEILQKI